MAEASMMTWLKVRMGSCSGRCAWPVSETAELWQCAPKTQSDTPRNARSLEQATSSGMAEAAHLNALRIMGAFELNRRLAGSGVDAFAVHPGVARTEVRRPGPSTILYD